MPWTDPGDCGMMGQARPRIGILSTAAAARRRYVRKLDRPVCRARLCRAAIRSRNLWRPAVARRRHAGTAALHLRALARRLLYLVDLLRQCRGCVAIGLGFPADLYRPGHRLHHRMETP